MSSSLCLARLIFVFLQPLFHHFQQLFTNSNTFFLIKKLCQIISFSTFSTSVNKIYIILKNRLKCHVIEEKILLQIKNIVSVKKLCLNQETVLK